MQKTHRWLMCTSAVHRGSRRASSRARITYRATWMTPSLAPHQQLDAGIAARRHAGYKQLKQARHPFINYFKTAFPCSPIYGKSVIGTKGVVSAYRAVQLMQDARRNWAAPWQRGGDVGGTRVRKKRQDVLERAEPQFGEDALDGVIARMLAIRFEWDREDGLLTPMLLLSAGLSAHLTAHSARCMRGGRSSSSGISIRGAELSTTQSLPASLHTSCALLSAHKAQSARASSTSHDFHRYTHPMDTKHSDSNDAEPRMSHTKQQQSYAENEEDDYVMIDGVRVRMRSPRRSVINKPSLLPHSRHSMHYTSYRNHNKKRTHYDDICSRAHATDDGRKLYEQPTVSDHVGVTQPNQSRTLSLCSAATGVDTLPTLLLDALRGPLYTITHFHKDRWAGNHGTIIAGSPSKASQPACSSSFLYSSSVLLLPLSASASTMNYTPCLRWKAEYRRSQMVSEMLQLLHQRVHATAALGMPARSVLLLLKALAASEVEQPAVAVALTVAAGENYYAYSAVESVEVLRCVRRLALVHVLPHIQSIQCAPARETTLTQIDGHGNDFAPEDATELAAPSHTNTTTSTSDTKWPEPGYRGSDKMAAAAVAQQSHNPAVKVTPPDEKDASCSKHVFAPLYEDASMTQSMLYDFVHDSAPFLVQKVWSRLPESLRYFAHHGYVLDWLDALSLAVELAGPQEMPSHLPNPCSTAPYACKYLYLRYVLHMNESVMRAIAQQLRCNPSDRTSLVQDAHHTPIVDDANGVGDITSEGVSRKIAHPPQLFLQHISKPIRRDAHARVVWLCASLLIRLAAESVGDVLRHVSQSLHSHVSALVHDAQQHLQSMTYSVSECRRMESDTETTQNSSTCHFVHTCEDARATHAIRCVKGTRDNCGQCSINRTNISCGTSQAKIELCAESEAIDMHKFLHRLSLTPVMHLASSYQLIGRRRPKRMRVRLIPFEAFPYISCCQPPPFFAITKRVHARRKARWYESQLARLRAPLATLLVESARVSREVERAQAALHWGTMVLNYSCELVQSLHAHHDSAEMSYSDDSNSVQSANEMNELDGADSMRQTGETITVASTSTIASATVAPANVNGAAACNERLAKLDPFSAAVRADDTLCWSHVRSRVQLNMDAIFHFIVWDEFDEQLQPLLLPDGVKGGASADVTRTGGVIKTDTTVTAKYSHGGVLVDDMCTNVSLDDQVCQARDAERRARMCVSQLHDSVLAFQVAIADILDEQELFFSSM